MLFPAMWLYHYILSVCVCVCVFWHESQDSWNFESNDNFNLQFESNSNHGSIQYGPKVKLTWFEFYTTLSSSLYWVIWKHQICQTQTCKSSLMWNQAPSTSSFIKLLYVTYGSPYEIWHFKHGYYCLIFHSTAGQKAITFLISNQSPRLESLDNGVTTITSNYNQQFPGCHSHQSNSVSCDLGPMSPRVYEPITQIMWKYKSFYLKNNDPITTQFCICHDSLVSVTCAKFWPDRIISFETRTKIKFS